MQKRNFYGKIISWVLVIGWMAVIFYLSAQHAEQSADLSGGITKLINDVVEKVAPEADFHIEQISYFVRKNAHFFAYMLLSILIMNALRSSGGRGMKRAFLAFVISVLYAISDEVHQLYVPGRSGQISDVLLDSIGALTGISLYIIISQRKTRRKREQNTHKEPE